MDNKYSFYKLTGKVQYYQWGGGNYLPALLNIPNPERLPFAEYWLGAHNNAPALLQGASPAALNEYLARHPEALGNAVWQQFQSLPYLLKVLDVKDMLSIQVHPTKEAAMEGFARENAAGIPVNAPHRNYKDDNHKPELMAALSEFWLLHGFKSPDRIRATLAAVPELQFLLPTFENDNYSALYKTVMQMAQGDVNRHLQPLLNRIIPLYQSNQLAKQEADFWAARAALTFNQDNVVDRGIFSVYLLNLVHLQPGEAIFQDAGILHAYLEGQNMEIMANSDNVLRGGLTPKYIDVSELMKHVLFQPVIPAIVEGTAAGTHENVFRSPAPDFQLSSIVLPAGETAFIESRTTEIWFVLSGSVEASGVATQLTLNKGEAMITFSGTAITLKSIADAVLYRATVPVK